ncbi:MAG: hypothetical protein RID07_06465 [Lacipirellulaceae bacterium]
MIFGIAGCDTLRGFTRTVHLDHYPSADCIVAAAEAVDGISNVSYSREQAGRAVMFEGIQPAGVVHRYRYTYRNLENNFYFLESHGDKIEFRHGYAGLSYDPPQKDVEMIYRVVIELERELEKRCNIDGLASRVEEYCNGVRYICD